MNEFIAHDSPEETEGYDIKLKPLSQDLQYRLHSQIWKLLTNFTFFCGFSDSCQLLVLRW